MNDLLEILHALGDDFHAHVVSQIDQRLDDRRRIAIDADGVDKHLVDLDDIDAELEHVGKATMAGADIVDRTAHPALATRR